MSKLESIYSFLLFNFTNKELVKVKMTEENLSYQNTMEIVRMMWENSNYNVLDFMINNFIFFGENTSSLEWSFKIESHFMKCFKELILNEAKDGNDIFYYKLREFLNYSKSFSSTLFELFCEKYNINLIKFLFPFSESLLHKFNEKFIFKIQTIQNQDEYNNLKGVINMLNNYGLETTLYEEYLEESKKYNFYYGIYFNK
jgi:hypothetical protein